MAASSIKVRLGRPSRVKQGGLSYDCYYQTNNRNNDHENLIITHRTSPPSSALDANREATPPDIHFCILERLPPTIHGSAADSILEFHF